jgi:hypothetical protein
MAGSTLELEKSRGIVAGALLSTGAELTADNESDIASRLHLSDFQLDSIRQEHLWRSIKSMTPEEVKSQWGAVRLEDCTCSTGLRRLFGYLGDNSAQTVADLILTRTWPSIGSYGFVGPKLILELKEMLNELGATLEDWKAYVAENSSGFKKMGIDTQIGKISGFETVNRIFDISEG